MGFFGKSKKKHESEGKHTGEPFGHNQPGYNQPGYATQQDQPGAYSSGGQYDAPSSVYGQQPQQYASSGYGDWHPLVQMPEPEPAYHSSFFDIGQTGQGYGDQPTVGQTGSTGYSQPGAGAGYNSYASGGRQEPGYSTSGQGYGNQGMSDYGRQSSDRERFVWISILSSDST
ncbi:hypothetical protein NP233_g2464 [Leucocoprinus birnbaumii]|uniref:Uncharacterized protein n=1 Tax=Leucocoprinus birnbaumii TaxID=56174 RepID=A0AAD5VY82_9AGAR|nr:hypothetical protein NP233_g2464 [Leucocoprinus birnbaumii]